MQYRICLRMDKFSDMGACAVLTEVPEMFGAEEILMNRCVNKNVFEKTVNLINRYKAYFIAHNQPVSENPSPGNKDGGITTLEEKSLGCVQKGGNAYCKYGLRKSFRRSLCSGSYGRKSR